MNNGARFRRPWVRVRGAGALPARFRFGSVPVRMGGVAATEGLRSSADGRADANDRLRARLAHQLRQPVHVIMMLAREISREPMSSHALDLLSRLIEASDQLNQHVAELLASPVRPQPELDHETGRQAMTSMSDTVSAPPLRVTDVDATAGIVARESALGRRVLLIDAVEDTRQSLARGLGQIGCQVVSVAGVREAIGELIAGADRVPERIIINSRSQGVPLQQTLLGIGHALQARVPIVVLSADLSYETSLGPEHEWRALGVVAIAQRPRSLNALRQLMAS